MKIMSQFDFRISVTELQRITPLSRTSWPLLALAGRARQGGVWSPLALTHSHKTSRERKHMRTKVWPLKIKDANT